MTWQLGSFILLVAALVIGFCWYERSRPPAQTVALVAAMAALAIAGRIAFAAFPNVKPTTDIVIIAGYALGPAPGFVVGALTALVSNFWFGQGPWTPWQMLAWGLCGILGALLATRIRNIGRLPLALVCAAAGIGYGALLNFSLIATYGGDLTLERFLALEARAVPFDIAHAVGNFAFALAAGPALIRMLRRFRTRFEWRRHTALAAPLLAILALAFALPAPASAAGPGDAARWLVGVQNADGGWGRGPGERSGPEITAWAMLGLAATERNPLDVTKGGKSGVDFLRANVDRLSSAGDLARTILALSAAGVNPRDFAGHDLVADLVTTRESNGSYDNWAGSTAFAIMALRSAGASNGIKGSTKWLAGSQGEDGGWGDTTTSPGNAEVTSAAMQAMPATDAAQRGLAFLRKQQRPNGGFPVGKSGTVNSQAAAWAAQGVLAIGGDPGSFRAGGGDSILDYLAARQAADGHYAYSSGSDQTPVWVTATVLPAVTGQAFPIPAPARKPKPKPKPESSTTTPTPTLPTTPSLPSTPSSPSTPTPSFPSTPSSPSTPSLPTPGYESGTTPSLPESLMPESTQTPESIDGDAAPASFVAEPPEAPSPFLTVAIGLAAAAALLGGVLWLGRRFDW